MQRVLAPAILGALLAMLATASAQAPTPTASLGLDLPPGPVTIDRGTSHAVPMEVSLQLENLVCPQAANATVEFAVRDIPSPLAGVRASAASATVEIPPGAYTTASPFNGTAQTALNITVGSDALPEHAHEFEVTASFPGGNVAGCVATGSFPAAEATATHSIQTGRGPSPSTSPSPPPTPNPQPGPAPGPSSPDQGTRSTPAAGLVVLLGAAAAAATIRR